MEYDCCYDGRRWKGRVDRLNINGDLIYARLSGRDSGIDIICGPYGMGEGFLCLPDYSVGCRLAPLADTFWNKEQLTPLIGDVDAVTVANGLRCIQHSREVAR